MLRELSDHVIVCGYGRVGREVAHELRDEGVPFVVIDLDPKKTEHIRETGNLAIQGNAANEENLIAAGIERAQGLVAAANTDAENVFIVLTARSLRPDLQIVARANYEASEAKLLRAGADRVISPYRISGRRMVTGLLRPDVGDFLDEISHTGGIELLIEQVKLRAGSPLVGQSITGAELRSRLGITVLACKLPDGSINTRPGPDTILKRDATIIVLGTREPLTAVKRLARGDVETTEQQAGRNN